MWGGSSEEHNRMMEAFARFVPAGLSRRFTGSGSRLCIRLATRV